MKTRALTAIGLSFLCIVVLAPSLCIGEIGQPAVKSPMPTPRIGAVSGSIAGKIYIIGGYTRDGQCTSIVEEYEPSSDKWTRRAPMPSRRGMGAAAVFDNKIYVIGGRTEGSSVADAVEVYDPVQDSWQKAKSLSCPRWSHVAVELSGRIHVLGGILGVAHRREATDTVEVYDPAKDSWTEGQSMPMAKQGFAAAVMNAKIYTMGGRVGAGDSGFATNSVEAFDPRKNAWSSLKPMQTPRTQAGAAVMDGRVYLLGGAAQDKTIGTVAVFDPVKDVWSASITLQKPRTGHSVISVGSKVYVIGGTSEPSIKGIVGTVEELSL